MKSENFSLKLRIKYMCLHNKSLFSAFTRGADLPEITGTQPILLGFVLMYVNQIIYIFILHWADLSSTIFIFFSWGHLCFWSYSPTCIFSCSDFLFISYDIYINKCLSLPVHYKTFPGRTCCMWDVYNVELHPIVCRRCLETLSSVNLNGLSPSDQRRFVTYSDVNRFHC